MIGGLSVGIPASGAVWCRQATKMFLVFTDIRALCLYMCVYAENAKCGKTLTLTSKSIEKCWTLPLVPDGVYSCRHFAHVRNLSCDHQAAVLVTFIKAMSRCELECEEN